MKKLILAFCVVLIVVTAAFLQDYCVSTPPIEAPSGRAISSMEYLPIGGISQFVLIRSYDVSNPVLLILHGGPGSSETAMFRKYNETLEKHFTVIYWDQRGAAKSFSEEIDPTSIHLEQYLSDTKELINLLRERFRQDKIYLLGHSWGSALGLITSYRHPELLKAYISVGQIVHTSQGANLSYNFTLQRAKKTKNEEAVAELEKIGAPVDGSYLNPEDIQIQRKWLLTFGGERYGKSGYSDVVFDILFSREYSALDIIRYLKGMKLSFALMETISRMNFLEQIQEVKIPVFFITGKDDYNTPAPLIEAYARQLSGPDIHYNEFEKSSHSPMYEEPESFNAYLVEIKNTIEGGKKM